MSVWWNALLATAFALVLGGVSSLVFHLASTPAAPRPTLGTRGVNRTIALRHRGAFAVVEPTLRVLSAWLGVLPLGPLREAIRRSLLHAGEYLGLSEDELLAMAVERNMGVIAMKSVRHVRNSDENPTELMRYAMSLPGVSTTIIGTGEVAHVEANAQLATNFRGLDKKARKGFSDKVAMNIPVGLPQPWDLPGYTDGMLA